MRTISDEMRKKMRKAATIFAENGFDGTTVEALSEVTGVPSSTLYYNFEGKEEILAFLLEDWLDRTSAAAADAVATRRSANERLADLVETQLRAMANDPATCQVLLAELGRIDRLPRIAEAVQSAFHRPLAKLLAIGVAAYVVLIWLTLRDTPALHEDLAPSWPALLAADPSATGALDAIVQAVAPRARCRPVDGVDDAAAAWDVVLVDEPADEPSEVTLTRFSTGAAFRFADR